MQTELRQHREEQENSTKTGRKEKTAGKEVSDEPAGSGAVAECVAGAAGGRCIGITQQNRKEALVERQAAHEAQWWRRREPGA